LGAGCLEQPGGAFRFTVRVGGAMQGPFECDFAEKAVHEFPLDCDWRALLETGSGNLHLHVELLDVEL